MDTYTNKKGDEMVDVKIYKPGRNERSGAYMLREDFHKDFEHYLGLFSYELKEEMEDIDSVIVQEILDGVQVGLKLMGKGLEDGDLIEIDYVISPPAWFMYVNEYGNEFYKISSQ